MKLSLSSPTFGKWVILLQVSFSLFFFLFFPLSFFSSLFFSPFFPHIFILIDIVTTLFRVVKYYDEMEEELKLEYLKVILPSKSFSFSSINPIFFFFFFPFSFPFPFPFPFPFSFLFLQEIGFTHMRVLNGLSTQLQIAGLLGRLCMLKDKMQTGTNF